MQLVYFDSFGTENIPQKVLNKVKDKSIPHNIFRIQDDEISVDYIYGLHRIYACRKKFVRLYQFSFSK